MARFKRSAALGDKACEAPVHHIAREVKDKTAALVVRQIVAFWRELIRRAHRVRGLRPEKPEETGRFVAYYMKPHMSDGARQKKCAFAGRHFDKARGHCAAGVFVDCEYGCVSGSSGMRAEKDVESMSRRVVPNVSGWHLDDIALQPAGGRAVSARRHESSGGIRTGPERHPEVVQRSRFFGAGDGVTERKRFGEAP